MTSSLRYRAIKHKKIKSELGFQEHWVKIDCGCKSNRVVWRLAGFSLLSGIGGTSYKDLDSRQSNLVS